MTGAYRKGSLRYTHTYPNTTSNHLHNQCGSSSSDSSQLRSHRIVTVTLGLVHTVIRNGF